MASPPNEDDDFDEEEDDDEVEDGTEASRPCAVASQVRYWNNDNTVFISSATLSKLSKLARDVLSDMLIRPNCYTEWSPLEKNEGTARQFLSNHDFITQRGLPENS